MAARANTTGWQKAGMTIPLNPVFLQTNFECRGEEGPANPAVAAMRGITGPEKDENP